MNNTIDIDISDLPASASPAIRSFVSTVREGYHTQRGTIKEWNKAAKIICGHSPLMHFLLSVAVGSLMRTAFKDMPGTILHIKGNSTTGKTTALQTLISLRADPSDLTWCFDGVATLKWYTIAADNNFLCLDDIHVAIMPDNGVCRPIPHVYFKQFEDGSATHTTIISTSELGLKQLAGADYKAGLEINVDDYPIWPMYDHLSPWWMDTHISDLKLNYGHVVYKVADSLSQHYDAWVEFKHELDEVIGCRSNPSKRALFLLYRLGQRWLLDYADIPNSSLELSDSLMRKRT